MLQFGANVIVDKMYINCLLLKSTSDISGDDQGGEMKAQDLRDKQRLDCDLVVVGGGAAGVTTATVAARAGLRVILIERHGFAGGGAVAGHSGTICGLYEATDNQSNAPVLAVHGFASEFISRMEQRGGLAEPVQYGKTFTRVHDPIVWRE